MARRLSAWATGASSRRNSRPSRSRKERESGEEVPTATLISGVLRTGVFPSCATAAGAKPGSSTGVRGWRQRLRQHVDADAVGKHRLELDGRGRRGHGGSGCRRCEGELGSSRGAEGEEQRDQGCGDRAAPSLFLTRWRRRCGREWACRGRRGRFRVEEFGGEIGAGASGRMMRIPSICRRVR